jgi:quinol monooxygenase YgiN
MANLQVSAKMKIREGMLEGVKQHANECIQRVTEKDPGTIQYDWFISSDTIYGDPSQDLLEKINARGVDTKFFSFLKGLYG